jgi:hypothetical protein
MAASDPEETFAPPVLSGSFAAKADLGRKPRGHLKTTISWDRPMMLSEVRLVAKTSQISRRRSVLRSV